MAADQDFCAGCGNGFPDGQLCDTCRQNDGMPPDPVTVLSGVAAIHHEWYLAWQESGFTEIQAFELVKTAVTAGFQN